MSKKFHLKIDEPIVVHYGEVGDNAWGHTQFPYLEYTTDGIACSWEYSNDTIDYDGVNYKKYSKDNGKTWNSDGGACRTKYQVMKNGKQFKGFVVKGAHKVDYLKKYTPAYISPAKYSKGAYFFAEDIIEDTDKKVFATEIDENGNENTFECKVNWPYQLLGEPFGLVYPTTMLFALCNKSGLLQIDGDMYFVLYAPGFNAEAKSREEAMRKYMDKSGVYVFRSTDCARTWDYVSQIQVDENSYVDNPEFEGFDEPMMEIMPDGSVVMLIRTGAGLSSYIARSTDNCKTWSKPKKFDDIGVFPQICRLNCGVILSSYGRPGIRVRASLDPAGLKWEDPIELPLSNPNQFIRSCSYTSLLPLNDNQVLLAYSDFYCPNPDGIPVKAILVRKITVVFED
ncbi:MAG: exo-alpha-sialidase [Clostridia bacterium]|nr:exo-alpha-sialidase [Clostridia bacterium]